MALVTFPDKTQVLPYDPSTGALNMQDINEMKDGVNTIEDISKPQVVTFTSALPLTRVNTIMDKTLTANVTLTANMTGAIVGGGGTIRFKTGSSPFTVTFPAGWLELSGSDSISSTPDMVNQVLYFYNGSEVSYIIKQIGLAVGGPPTLTTPTFNVDVISDTQLNLTSIAYDPASTSMVIERSTNPAFPPGLTTVYSGSPVTSANDTGLTASTHYYYRIKTTASGYVDSGYGTNDDTTNAAGLTPLSTPSLSLTVDSSTQITANWTNVANESSYVLQLATNSGFTTGLVTVTPAANVTTHPFTGLTASTLYYARVKAVGDGITYSDSGYGTDSDTTSGSAANSFVGMPAMGWIAAFDADNGLNNMVTSGGIPNLVVFPTGSQTIPTNDTNEIGGKNAWGCDASHSFEVDFSSATINQYFMIAIVFNVDAYSSSGTGINTLLSSPYPPSPSTDETLVMVSPTDGVFSLMRGPDGLKSTDPALPANTPTVLMAYGGELTGNDTMSSIIQGTTYGPFFASVDQMTLLNKKFNLGNYWATGVFTGDQHIAAFYVATRSTPYTASEANSVHAHLEAYYGL